MLVTVSLVVKLSVNNSLDLPSCPPWLWPLLSGASAELVGTNQMKLGVYVSFIASETIFKITFHIELS